MYTKLERRKNWSFPGGCGSMGNFHSTLVSVILVGPIYVDFPYGSIADFPEMGALSTLGLYFPVHASSFSPFPLEDISPFPFLHVGWAPFSLVLAGWSDSNL